MHSFETQFRGFGLLCRCAPGSYSPAAAAVCTLCAAGTVGLPDGSGEGEKPGIDSIPSKSCCFSPNSVCLLCRLPPMPAGIVLQRARLNELHSVRVSFALRIAHFLEEF